MLKVMVVVMTMAAACEGDPTPVDAVEIDADLGSTFNVSLGSMCQESPSPLCEGGYACCYESVCRPWCGDPPKCATHTRKQLFTRDEAVLCVCVPD